MTTVTPAPGQRLVKQEFLFIPLNFAIIYICLVCLSVSELAQALCDARIEFQMNIRKISRRRSRSPNAELCYFEEDGYKMYKDFVKLWSRERPFIVSRDLFRGIESPFMKLFRERRANMLIIVACKSRKRKRHSKLATRLIKCLI